MKVSGIIAVMVGVLLLYLGIVLKSTMVSFFQPILGMQIADLMLNTTILIGVAILLIIVGAAVSISSRGNRVSQ